MGDEISKDKNAGKGAPSKSKAPSKDSKASKVTKNSSSKTAAKSSVKADAIQGLGLPQKVDLVWAIALVAIAFVIGFLIRGLFASAEPGTTIPPSSSISSPAGSGGAPALSEDQVNSGQLPSSHPNIGGTGQPSPAAPAPTTGVHDPTGAGGNPMGNVKSDVPATGDLQPGGQSVEVKPGQDKK